MIIRNNIPENVQIAGKYTGYYNSLKIQTEYKRFFL